jgi:hypothetical protein
VQGPAGDDDPLRGSTTWGRTRPPLLRRKQTHRHTSSQMHATGRFTREEEDEEKEKLQQLHAHTHKAWMVWHAFAVAAEEEKTGRQKEA